VGEHQVHCRKSNEHIDDRLNDRPASEEYRDQVQSERCQTPIEASNDDENERDSVYAFHVHEFYAYKTTYTH